MSFSLAVFVGMTALLSGCALFRSDDVSGGDVSGGDVSGDNVSGGDGVDEGVGVEIVADHEFVATNGAVAASAPVVLPKPVNQMVTSLRVADRPSPNFDNRTLPVSMIVLHYTAAPLKESLNALRNGNGKSRVSAHYVVSANGTIFRLVDESKRAWHAGVSQWKGITDVNSASIGIEMVNLGHDRLGRPRPYTMEQVEAVTRLCLDIQARYTITAVVGHSDVAPSRKIDPGERFPWGKLAARGVRVRTSGFIRLKK